MKSPTIRDVAKRAGVGVGTVSRVLNESPHVRAETREKVLMAIKELNYSPNTAARQLSGGKTLTIGVVTAFFTFPSFVERLTGIQEILEKSEYDLVLYSIRSIQHLHQQLQTVVSQNRVDGLIILSLRFAQEDIKNLNPTLPVVVIDNESVQHYPHIMADNIEGGRLATSYLIDHGHEHIGFIGDPANDSFGFTSTPLRFDGFCMALEQTGLEVNDDWCAFGQYGQEAARQHALHILSLPQRPTAIFAANDTLAFGVLSAAHDLGLRVPSDLAVIGFDDIQSAAYLRLTTVRQHLIESGQLAARLLLEWLQHGSLNPDRWEHEMPLEIVERSTV
jgi:LacI family transcriptional regulator